MVAAKSVRMLCPPVAAQLPVPDVVDLGRPDHHRAPVVGDGAATTGLARLALHAGRNTDLPWLSSGPRPRPGRRAPRRRRPSVRRRRKGELSPAVRRGRRPSRTAAGSARVRGGRGGCGQLADGGVHGVGVRAQSHVGERRGERARARRRSSRRRVRNSARSTSGPSTRPAARTAAASSRMGDCIAVLAADEVGEPARPGEATSRRFHSSPSTPPGRTTRRELVGRGRRGRTSATPARPARRRRRASASGSARRSRHCRATPGRSTARARRASPASGSYAVTAQAQLDERRGSGHPCRRRRRRPRARGGWRPSRIQRTAVGRVAGRVVGVVRRRRAEGESSVARTSGSVTAATLSPTAGRTPPITLRA